MSNNQDSMSAQLLEMLKFQRKMAIDSQNKSEQEVLHKLGESIEVVYNGEVVYKLNSALILRQGVDASELRHLKFLHSEKLKYFDLMKESDDPTKLKDFAYQVECIEFEMQKAWHFPQDRNFHEWYKVPKCTCPKMDNADNRGSAQRIINLSCVVHGS